MEITHRPIKLWPEGWRDAERWRVRTSSPFDATYSRTLGLLDRELRALGARECIVQLDVGERGKLIADALDPQYGDDGASVLAKWATLRSSYWRHVAARHHPDHGGDEDVFKQLVAARAVLDGALS